MGVKPHPGAKSGNPIPDGRETVMDTVQNGQPSNSSPGTVRERLLAWHNLRTHVIFTLCWALVSTMVFMIQPEADRVWVGIFLVLIGVMGNATISNNGIDGNDGGW